MPLRDGVYHVQFSCVFGYEGAVENGLNKMTMTSGTCVVYCPCHGIWDCNVIQPFRSVIRYLIF